MEDVSELKVLGITGHVSRKTNKTYTRLDAAKFADVIAVQEKVLGGNSKKKAAGKPAAKKNKKTR
jgi:hypothetical protein